VGAHHSIKKKERLTRSGQKEGSVIKIKKTSIFGKTLKCEKGTRRARKKTLSQLVEEKRRFDAQRAAGSKVFHLEKETLARGEERLQGGKKKPSITT